MGDSLGNVFFTTSNSNPFLSKLEPSTNTITTWSVTGGPEVISGRMTLDSSGNVYFSTGDNISKLDTSTNTLTTWPLTDPDIFSKGLTVDSSGAIFFTESGKFDAKVARLVPATNTITEWTVPLGDVGGTITVDSTGNVFFESGDFARLVPSTNIFTEWNEPNVRDFLDVDSSGTIRFGSSGPNAGTIT